MRILHVINSLVAAGAENLVVTLANEQVINYEVSVFTFYSEKDIFDQKLDPNVNFYPHKKQSYLSLKKLIALYRCIKLNDVIHVHLFPPFYIVAFLSLFFKNKKFVFTEHNTENSRRRPYFKILEKFIYKQYDHIICISEGVKESLIQWMGGKVESSIIFNTINLKEIQKSEPIERKVLGIDKDSIILVMVGRFQKQKDQDTIIRSMAYLPDHFVLLLIGEGERIRILRNLVIELNLEHRVKFLGIRSDVFSILKSCDVGIISSHWEGFGIVAIEYMACGLPAIGSNNEGLRDVISSPQALFEIGNHHQLAELIIKLESNSDFYDEIYRQQQQHLIKYDLKTAVDQHLKIYQN
jgi:glycosyltransferase involved in cell wall biosynthesis